jgi:oligosaccharyltransferase complex subunit delta (ribophorin II)
MTCRFTAKSPVDETLEFVTGDTLRIAFTTKEGASAARPHQSFILIEDPSTNLEISIAVPVKPSGKAKLDLVSQSYYFSDTRIKRIYLLN